MHAYTIVSYCYYLCIAGDKFHFLLIQPDIASDRKVSAFVFIECDLCNIQIFTNFQWTHLHTGSLSFIYSLIQLNIIGNIKVIVVLFRNAIFMV